MRLTKTSLLILAIISLMALVDHFQPGWQHPVWPLLAATWLLLLLCERMMLWFQKVGLERRVQQHLYLGRRASIVYCVINHDKYPLRLITEEIMPRSIKTQHKTLTWNLYARQHMEQATAVTPLAPAMQSFTKIRLKILGRLALAWWPRSITVPQTVNIVPDYRATPEPVRPEPNVLTASNLHAYQSVTLVLNAGHLNQLVSGDLRRIDRYINASSRLAHRALTAHRSLNVIIYAQEIKMVMRDIKTLPQLGKLFTRLQHELKTDEVAVHRCVLPQLERIQQPGLLLWFTDLDDTESNIELVQIVTRIKQRFKTQVYNLLAEEMALLDTDLTKKHCGAYHKLAILTLQQRWRGSRQMLQRAGIPVVAA